MSGRALLVTVAVGNSLLAAAVNAGTYYNTAVCSIADGCDPGRPDTDQTVIINPDGIVYPTSFNPAGGSANLKVCVEPGFNGSLLPVVEWAVAKSNALIPRRENCMRCGRNEDPDPYTGPYSLATTVLHELGHCAMGLDHTTLIIGDETAPPPPAPPPPREYSSWTVSYDGARIGLDNGTDDIRGSKDDTQLAGGGLFAVNVFWFRKSDNNPVVIDATAIDETTFEHNRSFLPTGSTWPANANHWVTTDPLGLGAPETVAVMSDTQRMTEVLFDLTADDVNMVKMSRTGINRLVGGSPNDDHSIQMEFVSCTGGGWDLVVRAGTTFFPTSLGECSAFVDFVFPNDPHLSAQDYKLLSPVLTLNDTVNWSFAIPVFWNGFESGTSNEWSDVIP